MNFKGENKWSSWCYNLALRIKKFPNRSTNQPEIWKPLKVKKFLSDGFTREKFTHNQFWSSVYFE